MNEAVRIDSLGHAGDGIALAAEDRVFVPFTLPGETVTIDRAGRRGRLVSVDVASPDRTAPACRHFGDCGGCALQHMAPGAYGAFKREVVAQALRQAGVEATVEPLLPIAIAGRRRAVFSAALAGRGIVLGFQRRGSHEIVPVEECPVLVPAIARRLETVRTVARICRPRRTLRIAVLAADNGLDIAVEGAGRQDPRMLAALGALAADAALARLTVDGRGIFMSRRPEIGAEGAVLLPPPGSFVQASAEAEAAIAAVACGHLGADGPVLDLFAGCGTFSLRLARRAPVTAVEGDAALLAALDEGARRSRGLKPVAARRRDLFRNPVSPRELEAFRGAIFDPPAAGAREQAAALAASSVARIVAVSCNPATFARDARILIDGGYRLERVLPVDQFVFSAEIELVATFSRGNAGPDRRSRLK